MKIKITKADGTVIEAEGTAEECQKLMEQAPKLSPALELEDIRKMFAEELSKPRVSWWFNTPYPWWIQPYYTQPQPSFLPYDVIVSTNGTSGFIMADGAPATTGTITGYPEGTQSSWTGETTY